MKESITEEEAKALIERVDEIWNEGNLALVDELYAPDFVEHFVNSSEDIVGIDAVKKWVTDARTRYPDLNVTTEEIIVKDDKIVVRWTTTGTNAEYGKKVRNSGVAITHVVNGKFAEEWFYYTGAAVLRQLGFTITPPQGEGQQ